MNTNKERRLKLHEAICKCPKCKGNAFTDVLCPSCKEIESIIETLKDEVEEKVATNA
jgi:hypothetical protein